ncbi:copia protein [Tanacetum coccineum]
MADSSWIEAMKEELHQNKALIVAKAHRQEEGIDFDESFTPVARIEAVRMFLAYAHTSLFPSIRWISCLQAEKGPLWTETGLIRLQIHQSPCGIFINQSTYALDILKKHDMKSYDSIGTPMATAPSCLDTQKSTYGETQFLGEKLVRRSSKKQDFTALSTTEAEYMSLSACCTQIK